MRFAVVALAIAACSGPVPRAPEAAPRPAPRDAERAYTVWLGGARVGSASEREVWTPAGVRLVRVEDLRFRRGSAELAVATTIEIDADLALVPRTVSWREESANVAIAEDATRTAAGWQVTSGVALPADAVPAELVPLLVRRDGHFAGTAFLPARGFVTGTGRIDAIAPGRLIARLELAGGTPVEATIDLGADGMPARVVDGEGVIEMRATAAQAAAPFPIVDLIASTALAISGQRSRRLRLEGDLALPAAPGQRARTVPGGIDVELGASLPGALPAGAAGPDRRRDIAALVAAVRGRITPDLRAPATRDPLQASAGDCTTFALAYTALAERRGIATRVVTGLRVDGDRLVRHRWAVSWTGRAWIAVDAAFGAAPAGGDLVAVAVHSGDDAGLVAGEAALARVRAASWR